MTGALSDGESDADQSSGKGADIFEVVSLAPDTLGDGLGEVADHLGALGEHACSQLVHLCHEPHTVSLLACCSFGIDRNTSALSLRRAARGGPEGCSQDADVCGYPLSHDANRLLA